MRRSPITIAKLLVAVMFFAAVFAGLRSGSNDWFKLIYTATFVALVYAAIAAKYRGPFWHGIAVAGWAYFVVGYGPWIGNPPGSESLRAVNGNLATSAILEVASNSMSGNDPSLGVPTARAQMAAMAVRRMRRFNRDGIGHCGLTLLFAVAGGLAARALARRPADGQEHRGTPPQEQVPNR